MIPVLYLKVWFSRWVTKCFVRNERPFLQKTLTCQRKSAGGNIKWWWLNSILLLHCQRPGIVHAGPLSPCHDLLGHLNITELSFMSLATPALFLLWQVKMSAGSLKPAPLQLLLGFHILFVTLWSLFSLRGISTQQEEYNFGKKCKIGASSQHFISELKCWLLTVAPQNKPKILAFKGEKQYNMLFHTKPLSTRRNIGFLLLLTDYMECIIVHMIPSSCHELWELHPVIWFTSLVSGISAIWYRSS